MTVGLSDSPPTWEQIYRSRSWGQYPPEGVIRFVAGQFCSVPDRSQVRFLDLGCGTGAVSRYLAREGFNVCGVDGSPSAIDSCKQYFEQEGLTGQFRAGPLSPLDYPEATFDAVIDNVSMTHNPWKEVQAISQEVYRVLKPGGQVLHSVFGNETTTHGDEVEGVQDSEYCTNTGGALNGMPPVRRFSVEDLQTLFGAPEWTLHSIESTSRCWPLATNASPNTVQQYWVRVQKK